VNAELATNRVALLESRRAGAVASQRPLSAVISNRYQSASQVFPIAGGDEYVISVAANPSLNSRLIADRQTPTAGAVVAQRPSSCVTGADDGG